MELKTEELLKDLLETTQRNLSYVQTLKNQSIDTLKWRENAKSWNILECIEHLNRYGNFYIPEITERINASNNKHSEIFKSNWLGKYFSKSMMYNQTLNKMNTFKSMNAINTKLTADTLEVFITQQNQIIDLLNKAKEVNLDKTKTAISISKLIKLKLGDTFRVLIYHNERHVKQAEKVLGKAICLL